MALKFVRVARSNVFLFLMYISCTEKNKCQHPPLKNLGLGDLKKLRKAKIIIL